MIDLGIEIDGHPVMFQPESGRFAYRDKLYDTMHQIRYEIDTLVPCTVRATHLFITHDGIDSSVRVYTEDMSRFAYTHRVRDGMAKTSDTYSINEDSRMNLWSMRDLGDNPDGFRGIEILVPSEKSGEFYAAIHDLRNSREAILGHIVSAMNAVSQRQA
ncbi:MAG: hypothetical protein E6R03_11305 [Hyphomicrobiaceae bacterium]|nr:MAG: hypothetical protein E6R03_11305 [Hyphomicrobiaceae bacterium]